MSPLLSKNADVIEAVVSKLCDEPAKEAKEKLGKDDDMIEVGIVESAIGLDDNEVKVILGVMPCDGEFIDFKEACKEGIIENVETKNTEILPQLSDKNGEGKIVKLVTLEKEPTLLNARYELVYYVIFEYMSERHDVFEALYLRHKSNCFDLHNKNEEDFVFRDCFMGDEIELSEAIDRGLFCINVKLYYDNYLDKWMSLSSATEKGFAYCRNKELIRCLVNIEGVRRHIRRGMSFVNIDQAIIDGILKFSSVEGNRSLEDKMLFYNDSSPPLEINLSEAVKIGALKCGKKGNLVEIEVDVFDKEEILMDREVSEEVNLFLWEMCNKDRRLLDGIALGKQCLDPLDVMNYEDKNDQIFMLVFHVMCAYLFNVDKDMEDYVLVNQSDLVGMGRSLDGNKVETSFVLDVTNGQLTSLYNVYRYGEEGVVYALVKSHQKNRLSREEIMKFVNTYDSLAKLRHEDVVMDVLKGFVDLEDVIDERVLELLANNGFIGVVRRDNNTGSLRRVAVHHHSLLPSDGKYEIGKYIPEWRLLRRDCTVDNIPREEWHHLRVAGSQIPLELALKKKLLREKSVVTFDPLSEEVDVGFLDEDWQELMKEINDKMSGSDDNGNSDLDNETKEFDSTFELLEIKNSLLIGRWNHVNEDNPVDSPEVQNNSQNSPECAVIYGVISEPIKSFEGDQSIYTIQENMIEATDALDRGIIDLDNQVVLMKHSETNNSNRTQKPDVLSVYEAYNNGILLGCPVLTSNLNEALTRELLLKMHAEGDLNLLQKPFNFSDKLYTSNSLEVQGQLRGVSFEGYENDKADDKQRVVFAIKTKTKDEQISWLTDAKEIMTKLKSDQTLLDSDMLWSYMDKGKIQCEENNILVCDVRCKINVESVAQLHGDGSVTMVDLNTALEQGLVNSKHYANKDGVLDVSIMPHAIQLGLLQVQNAELLSSGDSRVSLSHLINTGNKEINDPCLEQYQCHKNSNMWQLLGSCRKVEEQLLGNVYKNVTDKIGVEELREFIIPDNLWNVFLLDITDEKVYSVAHVLSWYPTSSHKLYTTRVASLDPEVALLACVNLETIQDHFPITQIHLMFSIQQLAQDHILKVPAEIAITDSLVVPSTKLQFVTRQQAEDEFGVLEDDETILLLYSDNEEVVYLMATLNKLANKLFDDTETSQSELEHLEYEINEFITCNEDSEIPAQKSHVDLIIQKLDELKAQFQVFVEDENNCSTSIAAGSIDQQTFDIKHQNLYKFEEVSENSLSFETTETALTYPVTSLHVEKDLILELNNIKFVLNTANRSQDRILDKLAKNPYIHKDKLLEQVGEIDRLQNLCNIEAGSRLQTVYESIHEARGSKFNEAEKYFLEVRNFQELVELALRQARNKLQAILDKIDSIRKTLQGIRDQVGDLHNILNNLSDPLTDPIPLRMKELENGLTHLYKIRRESKTLGNKLDKFEKSLDPDFWTNSVYESERMLLQQVKNELLEKLDREIQGETRKLDEVRHDLTNLQELSGQLHKEEAKYRKRIHKNGNTDQLQEIKTEIADNLTGILGEWIDNRERLVTTEGFIKKDELMRLKEPEIIDNLLTEADKKIASLLEKKLEADQTKMEQIEIEINKDLPKQLSLNFDVIRFEQNEIKNHIKWLMSEAKVDCDKLKGCGNEFFDLTKIKQIENQIFSLEKQLEDKSILLCKEYEPLLVDFLTNQNDCEDKLEYLEQKLEEGSIKANELEGLEDNIKDVEEILNTLDCYGDELFRLVARRTCDPGTVLIEEVQVEIVPLKERLQELSNKVKERADELKLESQFTDFDASENEELEKVRGRVKQEREKWSQLQEKFKELGPLYSYPPLLHKQMETVSHLLDQLSVQKPEYLELQDILSHLMPDLEQGDNRDVASLKKKRSPSIRQERNENESVLQWTEDLQKEVKELDDIVAKITKEVDERNQKIEDILPISEAFWNKLAQITDILDGIQKKIADETEDDYLQSMSGPKVTVQSIEVALLKEDIDYQGLEVSIEECQKTLDTELLELSNELADVGGRGCKLEVTDALETISEETQNTKESVQEHREKKEHEKDRLTELQTQICELGECLAPLEHRVFHELLSPVDPDQRLMQVRLLELQAVQGQLRGVGERLEKVRVQSQVKDRYEECVEAVAQFQIELREKCVEIGELEVVLEEYYSTLLELENQIKNFTSERCSGDSNYSRACLKNLQTMIASYQDVHQATRSLEDRLTQSSRASVNNPRISKLSFGSNVRLSGSMRDISASFRDILNVNSTRGGSLTVYGKWQQLDKLFDTISLLIPEKKKMIHDLICEEQEVERDLEKHLEFLVRKNDTLKNPLPNTGLDADLNRDLENNYQKCLQDLEITQRPLIEVTVSRASAIVATINQNRNQQQENAGRTEKLSWLIKCVKTVYEKCHGRCQRKIQCASSRLKLLEEWIREKTRITNGITAFNKMYLKSQSPSKLTNKCRSQIREIEKDEERVKAIYEELNIVHEWGREIQTVLAKQHDGIANRVEQRKLELEMRDAKLQLDKVTRAIQQRIRLFSQQYKMDKEFSDGHETLLKWLDKSALEMEQLKAKTQDKIQDHLDKLKLSAQYANMHATIRHGTYLMDRCTNEDPEKQILKEMIMEIKIKWAKVRGMLTSGKKDILKKISETGDIRESIKCFDYWVSEMQHQKRAEDKFGLRGDADTVEMLVQDSEDTKAEAIEYLEHYGKLRDRLYREIQNYKEFDMRDQVESVQARFKEYIEYMDTRIWSLKHESTPLADILRENLFKLQDWIERTDRITQKELGKIKKDLVKLRYQLEVCEALKQETMTGSLKSVVESVKRTVNGIMESCYGGCKRYVERVNQMEMQRYRNTRERLENRISELLELLGQSRDNEVATQELIDVVALYTDELKLPDAGGDEEEVLPKDLESSQELLQLHKAFQSKVERLHPQILKLVNIPTTNKKHFSGQMKSRHSNPSQLRPSISKLYSRRSTIAATTTSNSTKKNNSGGSIPLPLNSSATNWSASTHALNKPSVTMNASNTNLAYVHEGVHRNPQLNALSTNYNQLIKLTSARMKKLNNHVATLKEAQLLENFNLGEWKTEFAQFVRQKGIRLTDIFRRQAVVQSGHLSQQEFVSCLSRLGLHPDLCSPAILKRVFTSFISASRLGPNSHVLSYQEFIDSLKPDNKKVINPNDTKAVTKFIHDTIEREVARCQCQNRFHVKKEGPNKYRLGSNSKMHMVRYLNSVVMVRIGGGWQTLPEFLKQHDPCRSISASATAFLDSPTSSSKQQGHGTTSKSSTTPPTFSTLAAASSNLHHSLSSQTESPQTSRRRGTITTTHPTSSKIPTARYSNTKKK